MTPKIKSGQLVTVSPDISSIDKGDVVLCSVGGKQYLHYVEAKQQYLRISQPDPVTRYLIQNARGRVNGWTSTIYGRVIKIED